MTEELELRYGSVIITKGKHKGKIGYYDDDEGSKCIIYFDTPFFTDYVLINHKYVANTDTKHIPTSNLILSNYEKAKLLGIVE